MTNTADLPYLNPMTSTLLQKIQSVHWQPVKEIKKSKVFLVFDMTAYRGAEEEL
jgi:hypothetical protein